MKTTGNYRQGIERFVPSPSEAMLLLALVLFSWKLFPSQNNEAIAGLSTLTIVVVAWVAGVALRAGLNDMRWWLLIGFILAMLIPWMAQNTFQLRLMSQVCVFALIIFGLNVVTGYTGQISLGHGALVGISAYTIAVLVHYSGWPLVPAILVGVAVTTVFGFALGIPALRLAGPYLAIATLAAALIFPLVVKLDVFSDYTGGGQGISETRVETPPGIDNFLSTTAPPKAYSGESAQGRFSQEAWIYYLSLGAMVIGLFAVWNLGRSRFGRAFIAVRDGEVAATSMGINVALYKVTAFGISALYAGVAGAMLFIVVAFVAPESFDLLNLSINPLAYMVIGGLATTGGGLVGAFGYVWVPQVILKIATLTTAFDKLQGAMTGLLLIVVMTRLPQGVWGAVVHINRYSWETLGSELLAWARGRSVGFWIVAGIAIVAIVLVGWFIGPVWAVFVAGVVIVAPVDAWISVYEAVQRPFHWRRRAPAVSSGESPQPDAT